MKVASALAAIEGARIVPVVAINDATDAPALVAALVDGGLPVVEITLRTAAGIDAIRRAVQVDGAVIGAGTVVTAAQAEAAVAAGAAFIVSPGLATDVVEWCQEHDVAVVPGIATPTELMSAVDLGLPVAKVFPANLVGGLGFVKAVASLSLPIRYLPTGGVNADNAADYLAHPSVVAVGGTWIAPAALVDARDWPAINERARACAPLVETGS